VIDLDPPMRVYCVGGAVRDELLGLPVRDRDWVVVGGTPQALIDRGFRPVGRDFPVFLHPDTHEEYALARTERKTAAGYRGFAVHYAPDVTLEDDLRRRDLTINAIARDGEGGIVDPLGGVADLRARVLRHAGPAFVEDPVRILRLARFAARFTDFSVAPETAALMAQMCASGEVDALVPERVWQELSRGLMEARPSRMVAILGDCGALPRLLPGLTTDPAGLRALDATAAANATLPVRFALLLHGAGEAPGLAPPAIAALCDRLRVPAEARELALVVARESVRARQAADLPPAGCLALLESIDALRRPGRLDGLIAACQALAATPADGARCAAAAARLRQALRAAAGVDAGAIAAAARAEATGPAAPADTRAAGDALRERIRAVRLAAIAALDGPA
jgi:tRNA nucleotidyltransferase (CCA-adding enzyme)